MVTDVTLGQILSFFTGTEYPPALGFDDIVSLKFNSTSEFPMASTCALDLILPTKYYLDENSFREKMIYGILNHGGFGIC